MDEGCGIVYRLLRNEEIEGKRVRESRETERPGSAAPLLTHSSIILEQDRPEHSRADYRSVFLTS